MMADLHDLVFRMKPTVVNAEIVIVPDYRTMEMIEYYENGKIKSIVFRNSDDIERLTKNEENISG
jgi:hypothetical protein